MSTLRTVLLGTLVILALGTVTAANAAVTYTAILETTGPYYRVVNNPGVDQMVDNPVWDMAYVQPNAVAARVHGSRDVLYVVDSGHNRVMPVETNALYKTDNTFAWASPLTAASQYNATHISLSVWVSPAATRWVIPHSEVVTINGAVWTWVADLTGFVAADHVYTISYTAAGAAPVITLPANSLVQTPASTIVVSYACTDYHGGGTAAFGLGDVDEGTSNGANPVLTPIDQTSGGPSSWQDVEAIALTANKAAATSDDIFLLDPADNSAGGTEKLFYYTVTAAGAITYREAYDDVLTAPYGVAAALGGTEVAAAAVKSGAGTLATAVAVRDKSQVTGHTYTIVSDGTNCTVTDATTGAIIVNAGLVTALNNAFLAIPGLNVTLDNTVAIASSNTITTTRAAVGRYLFVTDTGANRIKVISASGNTPTGTDDWLPGDVHTMAVLPAGAGTIGTTADTDYYYTTPGTVPQDYSVWAEAYPIKQGTLTTITFDPAGTPATWTAIGDLSTAGPTDDVFSVDWTSGKITFGDGVHGAIPPAGTAFSFGYTTTPDVIRYGSAGTGPGRFSAPRGIAARWNSSLGVFDVYVADTGNNRIQKFAFTPANPSSGLAAQMDYVCEWNTASNASDFLNSPVNVTVAEDGATPKNCWVGVVDAGNNRIVTYKDLAAETGGGSAAPTYDSSAGNQGNTLGSYMQPSGITFVANGTGEDLYVTDATRGTVTKYTQAPTPTIGVTNFSATGTCYPPNTSVTFNITSANPPTGGTIDIYYDTASVFNPATAKLCLPQGSTAASATTADWNIASTPGGAPPDGDAYYLFFEMKDANGAIVASDQTDGTELFCVNSALVPTLGGADAVDGDYTVYLQNGLSRVVNLQLTYPDSVIAVGYSGTFDKSVVSITGITQGTGWDVPDNDHTNVLFNSAYNDTAGTYQVNSSILGSKIGLVSAGPHNMAQISLQAKSNAITTGTRFKNSTFSILTASSGMKDIHGSAPTAWRVQNVRLRFGYLGDIATTGAGADSVLPHLAAKPDGLINFDDQMVFTLGWNGVNGVQDPIADIGPTTGAVPDLLPVPDGKWNVDDILAFTLMYSWAASNGYYQAGPQALGSQPTAPRPQPLGTMVPGTADASTISHVNQPKVGQTMTVDLMVNNAQNLSGALLNLGYDPSRLELISVEDGGFLDGANGCLFLHREGAGWVEIAATRLDRKSPVVSGTGAVACATFKILDEEAGALDLNYDLRTASGHVLSRGHNQLDPYAGGAAAFQLYPAQPNPVHGLTNIVFSLPSAAGVGLKVYDVGGRCVRSLVDGTQQSGYHVVSFDGRNDRGEQLPAGMYFYRLESGGNKATRKLILTH